jgi:hypothetical protein
VLCEAWLSLLGECSSVLCSSRKRRIRNPSLGKQLSGQNCLELYARFFSQLFLKNSPDCNLKWLHFETARINCNDRNAVLRFSAWLKFQALRFELRLALTGD